MPYTTPDDLNSDLAFASHFAPEINIEGYDLPGDWVNDLAELCGKDKGYFDKFIGETSTYSQKKD